MRISLFLSSLLLAALRVEGSSRRDEILAGGRPTKSATSPKIKERRSALLPTTTSSPSGIVTGAVEESDSFAPAVLKRKPDPGVDSFATPPRPMRRATAAADTPRDRSPTGEYTREEPESSLVCDGGTSSLPSSEDGVAPVSADYGSPCGAGAAPGRVRRSGRVKPFTRVESGISGSRDHA